MKKDGVNCSSISNLINMYLNLGCQKTTLDLVLRLAPFFTQDYNLLDNNKINACCAN